MVFGSWSCFECLRGRCDKNAFIGRFNVGSIEKHSKVLFGMETLEILE
jgi:hypothetical protein